MSKGKSKGLLLSGLIVLSAALVAALAASGVALMVWLAGFEESWAALAMLLTWGCLHFAILASAARWFEARES